MEEFVICNCATLQKLAFFGNLTKSKDKFIKFIKFTQCVWSQIVSHISYTLSFFSMSHKVIECNKQTVIRILSLLAMCFSRFYNLDLNGRFCKRLRKKTLIVSWATRVCVFHPYEYQKFFTRGCKRNIHTYKTVFVRDTEQWTIAEWRGGSVAIIRRNGERVRKGAKKGIGRRRMGGIHAG